MCSLCPAILRRYYLTTNGIGSTKVTNLRHFNILVHGLRYGLLWIPLRRNDYEAIERLGLDHLRLNFDIPCITITLLELEGDILQSAMKSFFWNTECCAVDILMSKDWLTWSTRWVINMIIWYKIIIKDWHRRWEVRWIWCWWSLNKDSTVTCVLDALLPFPLLLLAILYRWHVIR